MANLGEINKEDLLRQLREGRIAKDRLQAAIVAMANTGKAGISNTAAMADPPSSPALASKLEAFLQLLAAGGGNDVPSPASPAPAANPIAKPTWW